jgi:diguanylate cyclase (GGDEF)-like protein
VARILVVDDDPKTLELYRDVLMGAGHEVAVAEDGTRGLELADSQAALIVVDLAHPPLNSHEFVKRLRATDGHASIPTVIVSAVATGERALRVGADRFLQKPFRPHELIALVAELLAEEPAATQTADEPRRVHSALPTQFVSEGVGLAALLAMGTRDGIAILAPDGTLVFWNSAAAAITGWSEAEAAEQKLGKLIDRSGSLIEIRPGMWVELRYSRVEANGQTFLILMFTDSTSLMSLRDARRQLRALGLIDGETGLPGRDLALVQLDQAIALARRDKRSVGLLSLKLDRFRQQREAAEGQVADEVIQQFAARITAFVRGSDVPARVSNESFLVVLTALTSSNDAAIVAVRLLLVLAEPFDVVGKARSVQCSVGVAEFPRDADDATALLGAALAAADRAQLMGGGQYRVASDPRAPESPA